MKQIKLWLSALLVVFLAACGTGTTETEAPKTTGYPLTITDQTGTKVTIEKQPERIVSLMPSSTEIAYALGLGSNMVGVTEYCNFPVETKDVPKIGDLTTNVEKVVAQKPDVVFADGGNAPEAIEKIRSLGIPVVVANAKTMKEVQDAIKLYGEVSNKNAEAEKVVTDMQAKVDKVTAFVEGVKPEAKSSVVVAIDPT
ncbi:MAG: helical backbone metal receptor, partial [Bacilli bacterium]